VTTKLRKRLIREGVIRESLTSPTRTPVPYIQIERAGLRAASARLAEAGRVLSAANEEKLRSAQEAIASVLSALEADAAETDEAADPEAKCATCEGEGKIREGNLDCPDCGGSGLAKDVKKEARRARLAKVAEAYSSSADDAADGAYIISMLLDLMSAESDEPDELPILQVAFSALMQWMQIEVAEIGGPEDVADSMGGMDLFGWEAARKRLLASGGGIKPREGLRTLREARPLRTDLVAISEAAIGEDGTGGIKVIKPGWGSSGYYAPEVLERDGPTVFAAGTKMFWDHPTMTEEWERPERSLRDLAAETITDAVWDPIGWPDKEGNPQGPGLYAKTRVFENFAPVVNELAPSIGVSIRAYGKASMGEAEGQTGPIIEELVDVESIDFVTFPGAGGQVLQLFEAARQRLPLGSTTPTKEAGHMEVEKDPKFIEERAGRQRAEERLVLIEAEKIVTGKLAEAALPDVTRTRLAPTLAENPPAKDGKLDVAAFESRVDAAIADEVEYLAKLTSAGKIRGMGSSLPAGGEDLTQELEAEFVRGGMTESAAKFAASGRR
jgi:Zn finger protein HypA/HybF involved in hydrogenase expression